MQYSSLELFCDECGLANEPTASYCAACRYPLAHESSAFSVVPVTHATVAQPALTAHPHALYALGTQATQQAPSHFPKCDFRPGSILAGRFQIQEEIGRGGFSIVYRAVDRSPGSDRRPIAIKRILLDQLSPRQIIDATETFNREVALLQSLEALDGIPTYYGHLTDTENWYLITQYIEGQTLEEYLQKVPGCYLKEDEVIKLGLILVEVLITLHTCKPPVIFRDLKPANIMLTPDNTLFLIDFGIARTFTPGKLKDTIPLGSPGYAPLEQYGRAQTDQRSDIYSLGATLQTLLTGRDPLDLQAGEPSLNPDAPSPKLRKLLAEMLATEPSQRPANLSQVKKRLVFAQEGGPIGTYSLGAVFGAVFSIILLTPFSTLWNQTLRDWLFFVAMIMAGIVESIVRTKFKWPSKTPKGLKRFWLIGVLTAVLPFVLINTLFHWLH